MGVPAKCWAAKPRRHIKMNYVSSLRPLDQVYLDGGEIHPFDNFHPLLTICHPFGCVSPQHNILELVLGWPSKKESKTTLMPKIW
jgi:hypothetical protein